MPVVIVCPAGYLKLSIFHHYMIDKKTSKVKLYKAAVSDRILVYERWTN
jgi:hypothetical protein